MPPPATSEGIKVSTDYHQSLPIGGGGNRRLTEGGWREGLLFKPHPVSQSETPLPKKGLIASANPIPLRRGRRKKIIIKMYI